MTYQELLEKPGYEFFETEPHLKHLMILCYGGSHSYGLNTPQSDVDIRGVTHNTPSMIYGMEEFEQFVNEQTDTTIYSFKKITKLLLNNNPNTMEMFGCREKDYIYISESGKMLKNNINLFLSQKAASSFTGYAIAQLRRLESAIAKDGLSDEKSAIYLEETVNNILPRLSTSYESFDLSCLHFHATPDNVTVDMSLEKYPLKDIISILSEINAVVKTHTSLRHRNNKKDAYHLNKHASHIIRLLYTGIDVLEGRGIITYREKEHDLLMDIKNGKYLLSDGTYNSAFFDMVNELKKRFDYAKEHTALPKTPNMKKVETLVMSINKSMLSGKY